MLRSAVHDLDFVNA